MFHLHLTYIISLFLLFCFGVGFFASELYLPYFKNWKSQRLHSLSKVYLDESIDNAGGLLDEGVRKARIAHLLAPENTQTLDNYLQLLYRTNPGQALAHWSQLLAGKLDDFEGRSILLDKAKETLDRDELDSTTRSVAGQIAFRQAEILRQNTEWFENPENTLTIAELLSETGNAKEGLKYVNQLLTQYPLHPEAIFLLTRISVHLRDTSNLSTIGRSLAMLSSQRNKTGIEAIRHMTLLHLLSPLSPESLDRCLELLEANSHSQQIDFLRICALKHTSAKNDKQRSEIIFYCSKLFDLNDNTHVVIFNRWLGRLGDYNAVLEYLPASKAKVDEELFKLRMNALAQMNNWSVFMKRLIMLPLFQVAGDWLLKQELTP